MPLGKKIVSEAASAAAIASVILSCVLSSTAYAGPPEDRMPPQAETGAVDDSTGSFEFGSDAEVDGKSYIIHWVCNKHVEGLVFSWEKARLSRGVFHPLESGDCVDDPHPVEKVAADLDYNAPILYTQGQISKSAAVYIPESNEEKVEVNPSYFRTKFVNSEGKKTAAVVEVAFQHSENELIIRANVEPRYLAIGFGELNWIASPDFVAEGVKQVFDKTSMQDVSVTFAESQKFLDKAELEMLPASVNEQEMLHITNKGEEFKLEVSLALTEGVSLRDRIGTLFVFDEIGRLIGTGSYSYPSPLG